MAGRLEPLQRDPVLADLIATHGSLSVEPADDPFERLVVSIINQQLSTESAAAIRERVFETTEVTPAGIQNTPTESLRAAGLSAQKIDYIRNVATAYDAGRIHPDTLDGLSDDAVIDELTEVRGVGVWTAKMYLLFCLGREDVFPVEDLGIRRAMTELYDLTDRAAMVERAEAWQPVRSYASLYLWRAMD